MKYLLVVFWLAHSSPFSTEIKWAQIGPFDNLLACQAAASQAEQVVRVMGAARADSFCSQTKVR